MTVWNASLGCKTLQSESQSIQMQSGNRLYSPMFGSSKWKGSTEKKSWKWEVESEKRTMADCLEHLAWLQDTPKQIRACPMKTVTTDCLEHLTRLWDAPKWIRVAWWKQRLMLHSEATLSCGLQDSMMLSKRNCFCFLIVWTVQVLLNPSSVLLTLQCDVVKPHSTEWAYASLLFSFSYPKLMYDFLMISLLMYDFIIVYMDR